MTRGAKLSALPGDELHARLQEQTAHDHAASPATSRAAVNGSPARSVAGSSWRPVDLAPLFAAGFTPPEPAVGARSDEAGLLYPGKVHTATGETESGKTWLALLLAAQVLNGGGAVVFVDFEDDPSSVTGRLAALDVAPQVITDRFGYIGPAEPLTEPSSAVALSGALADLRPQLAVIDGVTEGMALHGLELNDNGDTARFGRLLPRPIASIGAAVLLLDHPTKSREGRGRYALGAAHKLNGLDGAAFLLENRAPFGRERHGRSTLLIAKDRPGALRRGGVPSGEGLFWYGDLHVAPAAWGVEAWVEPAPAAREAAREAPTFRPTAIMTRISAALAEHPAGLSTRSIRAAVKGGHDVKQLALELLIAEGYVTCERAARNALMYRPVKPFQEHHE